MRFRADAGRERLGFVKVVGRFLGERLRLGRIGFRDGLFCWLSLRLGFGLDLLRRLRTDVD
jgi:hypothetical protein